LTIVNYEGLFIYSDMKRRQEEDTNYQLLIVN